MNKQVNVKFSVYIMVALEYILKGVLRAKSLLAYIICCRHYMFKILTSGADSVFLLSGLSLLLLDILR